MQQNLGQNLAAKRVTHLYLLDVAWVLPPFRLRRVKIFPFAGAALTWGRQQSAQAADSKRNRTANRCTNWHLRNCQEHDSGVSGSGKWEFRWGMDGKVLDHGHKIIISKIVESASWFQITGAHLKLLPRCKWTWWSLSVKHWVANPRYQNHTCCWSGSIWPPLDEGNTTWTVNVEAPSHFRFGLSSTLTQTKPNAGNWATYLETYWRWRTSPSWTTFKRYRYSTCINQPLQWVCFGVGYRIYTNLIAVCSIFPTSLFIPSKSNSTTITNVRLTASKSTNPSCPANPNHLSRQTN